MRLPKHPLRLEQLEDRRLLTITVDTLVDELDGSIVDGDISLRDAIAAAPAGETIDFSVNGRILLDAALGELIIGRDLTIVGPGSDQLTIDARGNSRVFSVLGPSASLQGLRLTGGYATSGGGIFNNGLLTLSDVFVSENQAAEGGSGGGIVSVSGDLLLVDSIISGNHAGEGAPGGGVYVRNGDLSVINSEVSGNSAGSGEGCFGDPYCTGGDGRSGGGIYIYYGDVVIEGSLIANNRAGNGASGPEIGGGGGSGGGIYSRYGSVTVMDSVIHGNSAGSYGDGSFIYGPSGSGGGIYTGGAFLLVRSTVTHNNAGARAGGGGLLIGGGVIQSSTIAYNSGSTGVSGDASSPGAGIASYGGLTILNSTISNNQGSRGSGVFAGPELTLKNSTVVGNQGGGVYQRSGDIEIHNSIVAGNSGPMEDLRPGAGLVSLTYSLIGTNGISGLTEAPVGQPDASGNLIGGAIFGAIDPRLEPLMDNGGPTLTRALLPTSPAVDAGDPTFAGPPDFDQREAPYGRLFGSRVDIGAFELQVTPIVVDNPVDEDDGDFSAGDLSLREAIGLAENKGGSVFFETGGVFSTPQTITLTLGELPISSTVSIVGPGPSLLTIDGNHESRLFELDDDTPMLLDVSLSGMTLAHGQDTSGGAILNRENLTMVDVVIAGNTASVDGGGIDHASGMLTVIDSILSNNSAAGLGGAIATAAGVLELLRTTVSDNDSMRGGGIASRNNAYVTVDLSVITGNSATQTGGGVDQRDGSSLTVLGSTVVNNGAGNGGGGIYAEDGLVEVTASTIADNTSTTKASHGGGGVAMVTGTVLITSSTISGNVETRTAGSDNAGGGGIGNTAGTLTIRHSTVVNNSINSTKGASANGGGIAGAATLDHTIVADNVAQDVGNDLFGEIVARYSLIEDTAGALITDDGGLIIGFDPNLGPLQDNGGPTRTHAPLGRRTYNVGDPAANAGVDQVPMTDQRGSGFNRIKGGRIDIGAVELDPLPPPVCDFDGDDLCSIEDLDGLISALAAGINDPTYDVTGEGVLNIADRNQWLVEAGQFNLASGNAYLLGDANLDGVVDGQDFIIWNANKFTFTGAWSQGDFNADGQTDGQDFVIWNMFKFQESDEEEDSAPGRISVEVRQPWEVGP
ncbi:MAG: choice-of-anchor Q domain-containing protein [Planctomycetota bacterium]